MVRLYSARCWCRHLQPFFLFVLSGLFANRDSPHCAAYLTEILPPVPGDGV